MSAALERLQAQFAAGVAGADRAILDALVSQGALDAAERLGVYREAYRARLADALADTFGHTARYLGEEAFRATALAYVAARPPADYSIRWYGDAFPEMLQEEVAELAALDWALRAAFDSADAEPLDADRLAQLDPASWDRVTFRLHPSFQLLTMRWNTAAIWSALDKEALPPPPGKLEPAATLMVWRRGLQPHFRTLDPGEDDALHALHAGETFAAVCERLGERAVGQAGLWLRRWVEEGLLC
jgi:hypothetical protein